MSKEGHFLAGTGTSGYLGELQEERNSPESVGITGESDDKSLTWLLSLKRLLKSSIWGFPGGTVVVNLPANAGDTGSRPGLGRSHMPRSD